MRVPFREPNGTIGTAGPAEGSDKRRLCGSAEEPCGDIFIPIVENTAFYCGETDRSGSVVLERDRNRKRAVK